MSELLLALAWLLLAVLSMRALALLLLGPDARAAHPGRSGVQPAARPAPAPAPALPDVPQRASGAPVSAVAVAPASPESQRIGVVLLGRDESELETAGSAARRHLPAFWQERAVPAAPPDPDDGLGPVTLATTRVAVLGPCEAADTDAALRACAAAGRPLLLPART